MASFKFNNVYLKDYVTIISDKEKSAGLAGYDLIINDYYNYADNFEHAEIKMQKAVIENLLIKNNLKEDKIDFLIAGDLINQIAISTYNARDYSIPFIGIYAACATFPESLIIGSNIIESNNGVNIFCLTSSHTLTAERQYRFPVEYGNTKPDTATTTATGAVGVYLTNKESSFKIISGTIGKVIDMGINDVNHMGAVMAPACADTIFEHLKNNKKTIKDYDLILTGDLGKIGVEILKEYYEKVYKGKLLNVIDSGTLLYKNVSDTHAGASGPACLPLILCCKILKEKKYHKILIVGTGSLHTPSLINEKETIPAIAHAVEIEVQ